MSEYMPCLWTYDEIVDYVKKGPDSGFLVMNDALDVVARKFLETDSLGPFNQSVRTVAAIHLSKFNSLPMWVGDNYAEWGERLEKFQRFITDSTYSEANP